MVGLIDRNVEALIKRREQEKAATSRQEKVADAITAFAGSMKFVYLHLAVISAGSSSTWAGYLFPSSIRHSWCLPWSPRWKRFSSRLSS
jgi:hypothetical protein